MTKGSKFPLGNVEAYPVMFKNFLLSHLACAQPHECSAVVQLYSGAVVHCEAFFVG